MLEKVVSRLCGAALLSLALAPASAFARDYVPPGTVGAGKHVHQFVLRDPVTGAPMPGARYRLFLPEHKISGIPASLNGVIFGVTDSGGRTASVRMPKHYPRADWSFSPVIGEGDFGEAFRLAGEDGEAVVGMPYVIDMKGGFLACGKSGSDGGTYYAQGHQVQTVLLYTDNGRLTRQDYAWCKRSAEAVADLPASAEQTEIFRTMLAHYVSGKKEISSDMQERIREKLVQLAIFGRDSKQLDIALGLADTFDLNGVGYDLVDANWEVERGLGYIDEALAASPDDANILDSKGWGLFRLGKSEQALEYFERSIAAFDKAEGGDSAARAEGLAHKGEVLWQLGRRDEARQAFAAAKEMSADDKTLPETLQRLNIDLDVGDGQAKPAPAAD